MLEVMTMKAFQPVLEGLPARFADPYPNDSLASLDLILPFSTLPPKGNGAVRSIPTSKTRAVLMIALMPNFVRPPIRQTEPLAFIASVSKRDCRPAIIL
jgi:hypothetical protein